MVCWPGQDSPAISCIYCLHPCSRERQKLLLKACSEVIRTVVGMSRGEAVQLEVRAACACECRSLGGIDARLSTHGISLEVFRLPEFGSVVRAGATLKRRETIKFSSMAAKCGGRHDF